MAVAGDPRGYYRALGVERTASADDIKAAFRQRAKSLHPDQGGGAADKEAFRCLLEGLRGPARSAAAAPLRHGKPRRWAQQLVHGWAGARRTAAAHRRSDTGGDSSLHRAFAFVKARGDPLLSGALCIALMPGGARLGPCGRARSGHRSS